MTQDWTDGLVTVVYFIVGLGGVAGALLAMTKLAVQQGDGQVLEMPLAMSITTARVKDKLKLPRFVETVWGLGYRFKA